MLRNMQKNKITTSNKTGTAGAEGVDFQLNLILHVLLQVKKLEMVNFKLYTELKTAGKFDDIVLFYEDKNKTERSCLLQAKHVTDESKTVSFNDFVTGDKFNLTKYFESFKEIIKKEQFKVNLEHLILFTNLNVSQSLLPYVEVLLPQVTIWNCRPVEGNEKKPQLYRLNSRFIDEYQYSQLRVLSNVIIDYCIKDIELKHTNNNFKDCHLLLAREVFNVVDMCFLEWFIEGEELHPGTKIFRSIFVEEIQIRRNNYENHIDGDPLKWLRNQKLKFSNGFGFESPMSKSNRQYSWPILLKDDEKELFSNFCSYLILAVNQPNDGELEECLTSECLLYFSRSMAEMAKGVVKYKIRQWFKDNASSHLTNQFLDETFKNIKDMQQEEVALLNSRGEIEELNQQIEFETLSLESDIEMFMIAENKKLFQITTLNADHLSSIKTISCLRKLNHDFLFTSKSTIRGYREVFLKSKFFRVLVWHQIANSRKDFKLLVPELNNLVENIRDKGKKVIVIISDSSNIAVALPPAKDWIQRKYDETEFGHLTEETRNELLSRDVIFQGYVMEIQNILDHRILLNKVAHDSWGDLLSSGIFQIGRLSIECNSYFYIPRTIVFTDSNTEKQILFSEWGFIQHALLEVQDQSWKGKRDSASKIFILSDTAGMGKTTVSSSLAAEIKRSHTNFWVTRLVAIECAFELKQFDKSNTSDAIFDDFFISKLLNFSSTLERFVFGQYFNNDKSVNKFVVVFDGYDEINEECQRVIVKLLKYLSQKPNVGFIIITTRPQFQPDLEEHFKRKACILKPFDEANKIEFLVRYWSSRSETKNFNKLRDYAEQLIKCISVSITETESQLTGIPLQVRMIAEIYMVEARCYAQNEDTNSGLSTKSFRLFDLYEKFIKIKENNCLNEKMEERNLVLFQSFIKNILKNQTTFALETIFERSDVSKVEPKYLKLTTQFGIIQQNQEGDFYFIHRSFAEFLTAKYLLEEIIEKVDVPVADKISEGLLIQQRKDSRLYVVRKFINSRLDSTKLVEECVRSEDKRTMHKLLGEECKSIIAFSVKEEIYKYLKFTIEVNCWLEPEKIFCKLKRSLKSYSMNTKSAGAILNCMLDIWLPSKDVILLKTVDFLIRYKSVNADDSRLIELTTSAIDFQNKLKEAGMLRDEDLRKFLYNVQNDIAERGRYGNENIIDYLKH